MFLRADFLIIFFLHFISFLNKKNPSHKYILHFNHYSFGFLLLLLFCSFWDYHSTPFTWHFVCIAFHSFFFFFSFIRFENMSPVMYVCVCVFFFNFMRCSHNFHVSWSRHSSHHYYFLIKFYWNYHYAYMHIISEVKNWKLDNLCVRKCMPN